MVIYIQKISWFRETMISELLTLEHPIFPAKKKSLRRHFNLIYKTMAELLFPFDPLKTFPEKITQIQKYDIEWLEEIYSLFFERIEKIIIYMAFLGNNKDWLPWGFVHNKEIPELYNEEKKYAERIIKDKSFEISDQYLGNSRIWWPGHKWAIR